VTSDVIAEPVDFQRYGHLNYLEGREEQASKIRYDGGGSIISIDGKHLEEEDPDEYNDDEVEEMIRKGELIDYEALDEDEKRDLEEEALE